MDPLHKTAARLHTFRWPLFIALCLVPVLGGCTGGTPLTAASLGQQLLIGLVLGSVYALLALGYTLVYGVIKLINFAHADIYMLGAFSGYYILRLAIRHLHFEQGISLPVCFVIAALLSAAICSALAVIMERLAYRPLRKSSRIAALITAVGVSFLIENGSIVAFGANPKSFEPKTLAVYEIEFFSDYYTTRGSVPPEEAAPYLRLEVMEKSQISFPTDKLLAAKTSGTSSSNGVDLVRIRAITKNGKSPYSPLLEISPLQASGNTQGAEIREPDPAAAVTAPSFVSYVRAKENSKDVVRISWTESPGPEVALPPVFAGADGRNMAFTLAEGKLRVPWYNLGIVAVTLLVLWGLNTLVNRSMFGIALRALSFDMNAAKLMGIDTDKCIAQTFAVGGACAGLAGCMVGLYNSSIEPLMGILPGLKAFVAAVVGGIGSIPGAALGGLIMGLSESLLKGYINPAWSGLADALAFAILIVVLLFRPSGLLGKTVREKV